MFVSSLRRPPGTHELFWRTGSLRSVSTAVEPFGSGSWSLEFLHPGPRPPGPVLDVHQAGGRGPALELVFLRGWSVAAAVPAGRFRTTPRASGDVLRQRRATKTVAELSRGLVRYVSEVLIRLAAAGSRRSIPAMNSAAEAVPPARSSISASPHPSCSRYPAMIGAITRPPPSTVADNALYRPRRWSGASSFTKGM